MPKRIVRAEALNILVNLKKKKHLTKEKQVHELCNLVLSEDSS